MVHDPVAVATERRIGTHCRGAASVLRVDVTGFPQWWVRRGIAGRMTSHRCSRHQTCPPQSGVPKGRNNHQNTAVYGINRVKAATH